MDSRHGFGAQAWLWRETVHHEETKFTASCTAIALQTIHLFQYYCIFARPPSPACRDIYLYKASFSLRVYIEYKQKFSQRKGGPNMLYLFRHLFVLPLAEE